MGNEPSKRSAKTGSKSKKNSKKRISVDANGAQQNVIEDLDPVDIDTSLRTSGTVEKNGINTPRIDVDRDIRSPVENSEPPDKNKITEEQTDVTVTQQESKQVDNESMNDETHTADDNIHATDCESQDQTQIETKNSVENELTTDKNAAELEIESSLKPVSEICEDNNFSSKNEQSDSIIIKAIPHEQNSETSDSQVTQNKIDDSSVINNEETHTRDCNSDTRVHTERVEQNRQEKDEITPNDGESSGGQQISEIPQQTTEAENENEENSGAGVLITSEQSNVSELVPSTDSDPVTECTGINQDLITSEQSNVSELVPGTDSDPLTECTSINQDLIASEQSNVSERLPGTDSDLVTECTGINQDLIASEQSKVSERLPGTDSDPVTECVGINQDLIASEQSTISEQVSESNPVTECVSINSTDDVGNQNLNISSGSVQNVSETTDVSSSLSITSKDSHGNNSEMIVEHNNDTDSMSVETKIETKRNRAKDKKSKKEKGKSKVLAKSYSENETITREQNGSKSKDKKYNEKKSKRKSLQSDSSISYETSPGTSGSPNLSTSKESFNSVISTDNSTDQADDKGKKGKQKLKKSASNSKSEKQSKGKKNKSSEKTKGISSADVIRDSREIPAENEGKRRSLFEEDFVLELNIIQDNFETVSLSSLSSESKQPATLTNGNSVSTNIYNGSGTATENYGIERNGTALTILEVHAQESKYTERNTTKPSKNGQIYDSKSVSSSCQSSTYSDSSQYIDEFSIKELNDAYLYSDRSRVIKDLPTRTISTRTAVYSSPTQQNTAIKKRPQSFSGILKRSKKDKYKHKKEFIQEVNKGSAQELPTPGIMYM